MTTEATWATDDELAFPHSIVDQSGFADLAAWQLMATRITGNAPQSFVHHVCPRSLPIGGCVKNMGLRRPPEADPPERTYRLADSCDAGEMTCSARIASDRRSYITPSPVVDPASISPYLHALLGKLAATMLRVGLRSFYRHPAAGLFLRLLFQVVLRFDSFIVGLPS